MDEDGNDQLDFREVLHSSHNAAQLDPYASRQVCCWLSILTRGSLTERLQLCFNLYDVDRSGLLESAEIIAMAKALSKAPDGQASPNHRTMLLCDAGFTTDSRCRFTTQELGGKTVAEFEKKIRMMDLNQDARISFIELHSGVSADMEMQMLLGCGGEAEEHIGGEDDEEMLCAFCKVELDAMKGELDTATLADVPLMLPQHPAKV